MRIHYRGTTGGFAAVLSFDVHLLPNERRFQTFFVAMLASLIILPSILAEQCIPFDQAGKHIGETQCITGKVVRVEQGSKGVHYLDFCEDYRLCPFSVVAFSYDLKKIGDIKQLSGKVIEIHGEIKEYDGRAEIILERSSQLSGSAAKLPSLPKNFDVEQRGHFSAGKFRSSHSRSARRKSQEPSLPIDVESQ